MGRRTDHPTAGAAQAMQRATLAEVYLPGNGSPGGPLPRSFVTSIAAAEDGAVHLEATLWLSDEELLLLLFDPGSPLEVELLLRSVGIEPLRVTTCRRLWPVEGPG